MVSRRRKSRLPASIQIELIRHFVAGSSARSVAEICGINRNTAILYFHKLRELIANRLTAEAPDLMAGEIEVDESYFGGVRKGKRGRGAAGKVPVFGLLKRGGKVYTVVHVGSALHGAGQRSHLRGIAGADPSGRLFQRSGDADAAGPHFAVQIHPAKQVIRVL